MDGRGLWLEQENDSIHDRQLCLFGGHPSLHQVGMFVCSVFVTFSMHGSVPVSNRHKHEDSLNRLYFFFLYMRLIYHLV